MKAWLKANGAPVLFGTALIAALVGLAIKVWSMVDAAAVAANERTTQYASSAAAVVVSETRLPGGYTMLTVKHHDHWWVVLRTYTTTPVHSPDCPCGRATP